MQRLCKSNAIKLALIAEMPPILCKDTVFLSHRQTSWIILTQRLRVSVQKYHNAPMRVCHKSMTHPFSIY